MSEQTATYATKPLSDLTLMAVQAEALKAYLKHGPMALNNPHMPWPLKFAALVEEVGEVARLHTHDHETDRDKLVQELLQVAAVALLWIEGLEGKKALIGQRCRVFLPGAEEPDDVDVVRNWRGQVYHRAFSDCWNLEDERPQEVHRWRSLFDGGALVEVRAETTAALVEKAELAEA
jgi:hypothetical protein